MLKDTEEGVVQGAASAICGMLTHTAYEAIEQFLGAGGLEQWVQLLHAPCERLQLTALRLIANLAQAVVAGAESGCQAQFFKDLKRLGVIDQIVQRMVCNDPEVRYVALDMALSLAGHKSPASSLRAAGIASSMEGLLEMETTAPSQRFVEVQQYCARTNLLLEHVQLAASANANAAEPNGGGSDGGMFSDQPAGAGPAASPFTGLPGVPPTLWEGVAGAGAASANANNGGGHTAADTDPNGGGSDGGMFSDQPAGAGPAANPFAGLPGVPPTLWDRGESSDTDNAVLYGQPWMRVTLQFSGFPGKWRGTEAEDELEVWRRVRHKVDVCRSAPVAALRRAFARTFLGRFWPDMILLMNSETGETLSDVGADGAPATLAAAGLQPDSDIHVIVVMHTPSAACVAAYVAAVAAAAAEAAAAAARGGGGRGPAGAETAETAQAAPQASSGASPGAQRHSEPDAPKAASHAAPEAAPEAAPKPATTDLKARVKRRANLQAAPMDNMKWARTVVGTGVDAAGAAGAHEAASRATAGAGASPRAGSPEVSAATAGAGARAVASGATAGVGAAPRAERHAVGAGAGAAAAGAGARAAASAATAGVGAAPRAQRHAVGVGAGAAAVGAGARGAASGATAGVGAAPCAGRPVVGVGAAEAAAGGRGAASGAATAGVGAAPRAESSVVDAGVAAAGAGVRAAASGATAGAGATPRAGSHVVGAGATAATTKQGAGMASQRQARGDTTEAGAGTGTGAGAGAGVGAGSAAAPSRDEGAWRMAHDAVSYGEGAGAAPQPLSDDDISPSELDPTETVCLPGSTVPQKGCVVPTSCTPAAQAGAAGPSAPPTIKIRTMLRTMLVAKGSPHNTQVNVSDPVNQVLPGIRNRAALQGPARAPHPFTLSGNPAVNKSTKAPGAVAPGQGRGGRRGGVVVEAPQDTEQAHGVSACGQGRSGRRGGVAAEAPQDTEQAARQALRPPEAPPQAHPDGIRRRPGITPAASDATPTIASGVMTACTCAPQELGLCADPRAQAARQAMVAYGELTTAQIEFNAALGAFLGGIKVKLPLLAPRAKPLDMKHVFIEVFSSGGYDEVCAKERGWEDVSSEIGQHSRHGSIIQQSAGVQALHGPVEMEMLEMPVEFNMRPGRLTEALMKLLQSKAERPAGTPSAEGVLRARKAARAELLAFGSGGSRSLVGSTLTELSTLFPPPPVPPCSTLAAEAALAQSQEAARSLAARSLAARSRARPRRAWRCSCCAQLHAWALSAGSGAASFGGLPRALSGWEESRSLEALLLSHRATTAGPAFLRKPGPALEAYQLEQLCFDGLESGDDEAPAPDDDEGELGLDGLESNDDEAPVPADDDDDDAGDESDDAERTVRDGDDDAGDEQRRDAKRRRSYGAAPAEREGFVLAPGALRSMYAKGTTPRCGDCNNCNNLLRKQACMKNRAILESFWKKSDEERAEMGGEPTFVFATEEARMRGTEARARWRAKHNDGA
ncbi:hypothetical protein FOA52_000020 [Chlamydomonas sp. UWO 241]|nr:hypothetical protein FOA52_000020 [Chlamydomonas sp. UWO 241]